MKRRSFISYVLLMVCMIMLTASSMPHHHHQQNICIQHDLTECECTCANNHHSSNNSMSNEHHSCSSLCVTKFSSVTPHTIDAVASPDLTFVAILFSINNVLDLSSYISARITQKDYYYLEHLHSTLLYQSVGLRAPPYSVI